MRITFRELNRSMQYVLNNRFSELASLQEELATGKRLMRPSDDPVDVANDLKLRTKMDQLGQFEDNLNDGLGFMSVTDTSLRSMNDILQRLNELAVQGSTDTLSLNQRRSIGMEVEQLLRQLISIGNSKFKNDYIFGGTQTKIAPFPIETSDAGSAQNYSDRDMAYYAGDGSGGPYQLRNAYTDEPIRRIIPNSFELSYQGTTYTENTDYTVDYVNGTITILNPAIDLDVSDGGTFGGPNYSAAGFQISFEHISQGRNIYGERISSQGDVLREIESNITMPINITGEEFSNDPVSQLNLYDVVVALGQDLIQDNRPAIESGIGDIKSVFTNLLSIQSKNGARINRFEATLERNEFQTIETTRLQSELEDTDFADAVSRFSLLETVYNAALKSASKIIQPSLASFL